MLDIVPRGDALHALAQRYVTGRYFRRLSDANIESHRYHVNNYLRLGRPGVALEFGAGGSLSAALLLSAAGATVYAYDINRLASVERINHVIRAFRQRGLDGNWTELETFDELERRYRIRYVAPGDARATGLPAGSVDYFYSMSCLEHIPQDEIGEILAELRRIATPDALMGFGIGYYDHYATADKSISRCNFYRFSERAWRFWNPPRHYQNRLRHSDFERMFRAYPVLDNQRMMADESLLTGLPIDPKFSHYSREDLLTVSGRFLLRARPDVAS
jgi:SAM-dependent methyltransferase